MNLRRILIVSLSIIIVVFGGILIYFLLRSSSDIQPPPTTIPGFPSFPTGSQGASAPPPALLDTPGDKVSRIGATRAFAPAISPDEKRVRFFERDSGNLFEANFNGSELTKVSSSLLPQGLASVVWSPKRDYFAAFFENAQNNFIYNFATGLSTALSRNVGGAMFAPQSARIAYQELNQTESSIVVINTSGTGPRTLFRAALGKTTIQWAQENRITVTPLPSGLVPGFMIGINPTSGAISQLVSDAYGLSTLWSPSGKRFIYTKTDAFGNNLSLWLADENGADIKKIDVATLIDKCVWAKDNKILFCAVPETWPAEAVLPDDYYKGLLRGTDMFLRINTETDAISFVLDPSVVDAQNLIVAPQEDYLIFINRYDGGLYSIKL